MTVSGILKPVFSETLRAKWTGYLPILLVAPAIWLVGLPIIGSSSSGLVAAISTIALLAIRSFWSRRIVIDSNYLTVGTTEISLSSVLDTEEIAIEDRRDQMGPQLNANALVFYQGGTKGLVRIELQNEKWPYLLVSTNRAKELVQALKN